MTSVSIDTICAVCAIYALARAIDYLDITLLCSSNGRQFTNDGVCADDSEADGRQGRVAGDLRWDDVATSKEQILRAVHSRLLADTAGFDIVAYSGGTADVERRARYQELRVGTGEEASQLRGNEDHVVDHDVGSRSIVLRKAVVECGLQKSKRSESFRLKMWMNTE